MANKFTLKIKNLSEIVKKLEPNSMWAKEWEKALNDAVTQGKVELRAGVPRRTGKLESTITKMISPKMVPLWGKVTIDASHNGFKYPYALNAGKGKKAAKFHYAGTRRVTKGWITKAKNRARNRIKDLLGGMAKEIESKWGR